MGYESKVALVLEMDRPDNVPWNKVLITLNLGKMGYGNGWRELFTEPLVGDICLGLYNDYYVGEDGYVEQGYTKEDPYGAKPTQATVDSVYKWCCEHSPNTTENDFMVSVLKNILLRARRSPMPLKVVHTGY